MSKTVDERVVEMRFDNRQFESNVQTSMSTLDKLKQSLKFTGATKGLEEVGAAAKKVDMTPLGNAVETVRTRFSALEVMGVTALANITNSAVNAGKQMVKALTIDPIKTGFDEYETQINAVQTILANTSHQGTNLEQVNAALDELNKYADQTIYNFTEMTRNIGTFTAAGVDLETSVGAIKGIANLAAVSGSSAQQASTAMYQLSQALAAGQVSLQDWNSVVNAGMGGKVFQDALMNTAEAMGIVVDRSISFRESISTAGGKKSWLTSEVLLNTLNQFTGDLTDAELAAMGFTQAQIESIQQMAATAQGAATDVKTFTQLVDTIKESVTSGWAQTWEIIFGDFEEAKAFFSELSGIFSPIIESFSNARNNFLQEALGSNWDRLTKQINDAGIATEDFTAELEKTAKSSIKNYDELIEKHGSLVEAFMAGDISSSIVVDTLKRMAGVSGEAAATTEDLTAKLEYFQKVVDDVWRGDYKNVDTGRIELLTAAGYDYYEVQALVNKTVDGHRLTLEDLNETQMKSIGYTEEEITQLKALAKQAEQTGTPINELINNLTKPSGRELLLESVMNLINTVVNSAKAIGQAWREIFPPADSTGLYNFIEGFHSLTKSIVENEDMFKDITRTFKGLFAILDIITTVVGGGFKIAWEVLSTILGAFNMDIFDLTAMLGDAAVALRNFLLGGEEVAEGVATAITSVKAWIDTFMELPVVQKVIKAFTDGLSNLKDVGLNAIKGLQNGLASGLQSVPQILMDIGESILEAICNVLGIKSPSKEMFSIGEFTVEGLLNGLVEGASKIFEFVKSLGSGIIETLSDVLGDIDWGNILAAAIGLGLLYAAVKLFSAFSAITAPLEGLGDVLESVSKVINAKAWEIKAEAIKNIAEAIAILAGSAIALALVPWDQLKNGLAALLAIAVILGVLSVAIGRLGPDKAVKFAGFAVAMLGISTSLLIVSAAIKQLQSLDPAKANQTIGVFVAIVVSLMGMVSLFAIISKGGADKAITQFGSLMVKLSVSIAAMVGVIKLIGTLEAAEIGYAKFVIELYLGLVTVMALITNFTGKYATKLGTTMLLMSAAMAAMVGVVKLINTITEPELETATVVIKRFLMLVASLAVISRLAGGKMTSLGTTLLGMSAAIAVMAIVMKLFEGMDLGSIVKGELAIAGLGLIIKSMIKTVQTAGKNSPKIAATLLAMSASIGILAGIAALLSLMDIGALAKGITAVGILSTFMAMMIKATKGTRNVMGNLIVMTVAIGMMAAAVAGLSFIDTGKLAASTAALSILMGMFALIVKSSNNVKSSMATLIVMTTAVAALAGIIYLLQDVPVESALGTATSLSVLLLALSTSMVILSKAGKISKDTTIALGVLTLAIAGLAAIMGALDHFNVEPSIETAAALSTLLLGMSAVCLVLGPIGNMGPAAIKGALILDAVIGILGVLVAGIGALVTYFPDLQTFADNGVVLLETIGKGIGGFVGGIVGGVMTGVTNALPTVAENLSGFMDGITPFIEGAKSIDAASVGGIKSIAEIILMLTAADIVNGIASFLGLGGSTSLSSFAEQLIPFGDAMAKFGETIKGKIDPESTNAAANAGHMLAELNKSLPREGGWLQDFLGTTMDLSTFSDHMVAFGEAVVAFSETVAPGGTIKVNEAAVEAAVNAGTMIAELNKNLPKSGGVVQAWFGEQDLSKFSDDMVAFGEATVAFSETVAPGGTIKVNEAAVESAVNAGTMISELNKSLPKQGGFLQDFLGEQDLSVFGEDMVAFGTAIVDFSNIIAPNGTSVVNTEAVTASANAAMMLAELANNVPSHFGFFQAFTGEKSMAMFGADLEQFGYSLKVYAGHVSNIEGDVVTASADAAEALVKLADGLPEDKLFTNETTLDDFGKQLAEFGEKFFDFYEEISGINAYTLTNAVSGMTSLVDVAKDVSGIDFDSFGSFGKNLEKLGKSGVDGFINAFSDAYERFKNTGTAMVNAIIEGVNINKDSISTTITTTVESALTSIDKKQKEFREAGQEMISKLMEGMKFKIAPLLFDVTSTISSMVKTIRSRYDNFHEAGKYLVEGFADGIGDNDYLAENAARAMAQAAIVAAKTELDIHSPSEVFNGIGGFTVDGFVGGIVDGFGAVKDAGAGLGSNLLTSVQDYLKIDDSSSLVFKDDVGSYVVEGIADGIESDMSAEEAAEKKAQNIIDAFQEQFDRIDLSESLLDLENSLWESTNSTASDSAKDQKQLEMLYQQYDFQEQRLTLAESKYKQMIDTFGETSENAMEAYKEVLQAQIDLSDIVSQINEVKQAQIDREKDIFEQKASNLELEYSLWEKQNEQTATEAQKALHNIALLTKQYNLQLERVQDAKEQHNQMLKDYGENALQTYEAYNELLTQQVELADLANQIAEARQEEIERNQAAFEEYEEYMRKNERKLERQGYTAEEIQQMAMKETGYDPNSLMESMQEDVQTATVSAMSTVQTTYAATADATFQPLISSFSGYGATYATALGTGISDNSSIASENAKTMVLTCADAMKQQQQSWIDAGAYLVNGFVSGISGKIDAAVTAAARLAREAYEAATAELDINSPSKKFAELGRFVDLGFAKGITDHADEAAQASEDMARSAFSSVSAIIGTLIDAMNGDLDMQPTIRPVLDLSSIQAGSARLNTMFSRNQALTVQSHINQTATGATQDETSAPTNAAGFQFVQNNYSPKSLSRIEIYRQTKNQFSAFERMVKA